MSSFYWADSPPSFSFQYNLSFEEAGHLTGRAPHQPGFADGTSGTTFLSPVLSKLAGVSAHLIRLGFDPILRPFVRGGIRSGCLFSRLHSLLYDAARSVNSLGVAQMVIFEFFPFSFIYSPDHFYKSKLPINSVVTRRRIHRGKAVYLILFISQFFK